MALLESKGVPLWERNFGPQKEREDEDHKFRMKLFDFVCEARERLLYPEIIAEYREEFEFDFEERIKEEGKSSSKENLEKAWEDHLLELFLPQIDTEYRRVYDMPEPLNQWDSRNDFQQWFFIDKGDAVDYVHGGSAGSSQREAMGTSCSCICIACTGPRTRVSHCLA